MQKLRAKNVNVTVEGLQKLANHLESIEMKYFNDLKFYRKEPLPEDDYDLYASAQVNLFTLTSNYIC